MTSRAKATTGRMNIFVAAPMSGYGSDELYRSHLGFLQNICHLFETQSCVERVYFAGRNISSIVEFTNPIDAFRLDYNALKSCDLFLLYYPLPVRSSVLVEAGMAIGLGKNSFYACRKRTELPYLLLNAAELSGSDTLPPIGVWEWDDERPDARTIVERALMQADILAVA